MKTNNSIKMKKKLNKFHYEWICNQCGKPWHEYIPLKCNCSFSWPKKKRVQNGKTITDKNFELHFSYYQYNTGMADNGTYERKLSYKTLEEAQKDKEKVISCLDNSVEEEIKEKIQDELLPNPGYFKGKPVIYRVERCIVE